MDFHQADGWSRSSRSIAWQMPPNRKTIAKHAADGRSRVACFDRPRHHHFQDMIARDDSHLNRSNHTTMNQGARGSVANSTRRHVRRVKMFLDRLSPRKRSCPPPHVLGCGLLLSVLTFSACNKGLETDGQRVFKLGGVSVLEHGDHDFLRGQPGECRDKPFAEVKAYPNFKSDKPVYGSVRLGLKLTDPDAGLLFHFAVDESRGTGKGYDRLYFDLNRDGDLRNDAVLSPQRRVPAEAYVTWYTGIKQQIYFDCLEVRLDSDSADTQPVQLAPRLVVVERKGEEYERMSFLRTRLYEGNLKVGRQKFKARLGNDHLITGRLDAPDTALILRRPNGEGFNWWGNDRLKAAHKIGNRFYTFAANPTGDELTVRPYTGDLGAFAVGAGGRAADKLGVSGSLAARDLAVAVGELKGEGWPQKVRSFQVPVGDYLPFYLSIELGRLEVSIMQKSHSDGKPRDRAGRPPVYGIQIRKDKPFVLDFSNKPDVMFASPARDQRVKLGDTLEVKAVLIDPQLDLMIQRLNDTTRKQTKTPDGKPLGYERDWSLDPTVLITRANGEKVAEGVMPFG